MLQHKHCARRTMLAVFILVASPADIGAQRGQGRELVQVASRPLPAGFEVSGGVLSADGSILYWSRDRKAVMATNGETVRRLCASVVLDPIAAAYVRPSTFEIVDGSSGRLFTATSSGDCRATGSLGRPAAIHAAVYSPETAQWVALTTLNGTTVLALKKGRETVTHVPLHLVLQTELLTTHVTASKEGAIVSSLRAPFAWTLVSWAGRAIATGRPFDADTLLTAGSYSSLSSRLFGMATHAVGDEFLQVLADPRSDLRVLLTYDAKGRALRRTAIAVSLGILDFEPTQSRVLALRRTNTSELVTYSLHRSARSARSFHRRVQ